MRILNALHSISLRFVVRHCPDPALMTGFLKAGMLLMLCGEAALYAQAPEGWIEGQVRDAASLQSLAGVRIVLRRSADEERLETETDASGHYGFFGLLPGSYEVIFEKPGYRAAILRGVPVHGSRLTPADVEISRDGAPGEDSFVSRERPFDPWGTGDGSVFLRWRLENLPGARNIWALLGNQEPSAVVDREEGGGFATGKVALAGVRGSTWTQNGYRFDGVDITDPYDPGRPLIYPDYGALDAFQVSAGFHPSLVRSPAGSFQLTTRRGGSRHHVGIETYYLGEPFQAPGLDERLRGFGFDEAFRFGRFGEAHLTLEGPLPRLGNGHGFAAFGIQRLSRAIPHFSATPTTRLLTGLLRYDGKAGTGDDISIAAAGQIVDNSHLDARPRVKPEATLRGNDRFDLAQARWTRRRGAGSVLHLRGGVSHASLTDTFQRGISEPNRERMFTGEMAGSAPIEYDAARLRFSLLGHFQTWQAFPTSAWRHKIDAGIEYGESRATEERRVFLDYRMLFFPGDAPAQVVQYNTPSRTRQGLRELSMFIDDHLRISRRLFLRVGLTLDASRAFLPAQRTGAGFFAPARTLDAGIPAISWVSFSPRLGFGMPFEGRLGRTRLNASFARYPHLLPARYADFANPNSLGGRVYRWEDGNGDGRFQPGEEGTLLRVFGGPYSFVDPGLRRPSTAEWAVGVDHRIGGWLQAGARLYRRDARDLAETVNVGVPPSAFTPVRVHDPGDDQVPGTRDDRILTVFNRDPQALGRDRFLLTNPAGHRSFSRGVEISLRGEGEERGFLEASFSAYQAVGLGGTGNGELENDPGVIGNLFDDPNTLLNARGRLFFDRAYSARIAGYVRLPMEFHTSFVARYLDGLPFGRLLVIPGLNQGPIAILATPRGQPGGLRTQFHLTLDYRIGRDFDLGRFRCSLVLDFFNLLNLRKNLRESDLSGPDFPLRLPLAVQNPRVLRFGLKIHR